MKVYNIKPEIIHVAGEPTSVVQLGEDGRGRVIKRIACPESFKFLEPSPLGASLKIKPRVKLLASASSVGWIARISASGAYVRGANGNVSISPEYLGSVRVVASGQGAFGDAGRTGSWDDHIISTDLEDFWVRVKPSRADAYILFFKDGRANALDYPTAELLDLDFCGSSAYGKGDQLIRLPIA